MAKVLGLHQIELKPGVDEKEFEAFVMGQVLPVYNKMPGQVARLAKGDRGERKGKYLLVIELDSPEVRDRIYPVEGGEWDVPPEFQQAMAAAQPIFEKVLGMVAQFPDPHATDFVIVGE